MRRRAKDKQYPSVEQLSDELQRIKRHRRFAAVTRSTIGTLLVVMALSVLVAVLFLPILEVYGSSMTPTVSEGNIVVCIKGAGLQCGDICAFYYEGNILVKRVIATAGDWVDIDADGNIYLNGELLDEPYLQEGMKAYGTVTQTFPYQVPEGRVFVLGDHRSTSVDSRTTEVGCVAEENIVGKIVFRIWPLDSIGKIE